MSLSNDNVVTMTPQKAPAQAPPASGWLSSINPFTSQGSLYRTAPLAADARLLLNGRTEEQTEPAAWTRSSADGGRVFYTSLGHQKDFWELDFLRLVQNGILWSVGQPSTAR